MTKVAVIFDRFGPYHKARLDAAARNLSIVGIEVFGDSADYAWDQVSCSDKFRHVTLFPGATAKSTDPREVRKALFKELDQATPVAVAVPGWVHPAALACLLWCDDRGVPAIMMSESNAWDDTRAFLREWVKRRVVKMCRAGIVGGDGHRDYLETLGLCREKIFLGYDVVDNQYFSMGADAARSEADAIRARLGVHKRYWLSAARFVEKKNLSRLLQAYSEYRRLVKTANKGFNPWDLVLIGDGELNGQLLVERKSLGLESCVHLPGFVQYDLLPAYYGLASGFVHASTVEQWGLVVNEAMAAGLPVLVSNRCGCASSLVFFGENGATFDPFDTRALAGHMAHISGLSESCQLAMGRRSKQIIAEWDTDRFAHGLTAAVDEASRHPVTALTAVERLLLRTLFYCR